MDRRFIFGEAEKGQFVRLMRECEAFCQVRVLTFCVMFNHYRVLLEVPKRPDVPTTAEELLELLKGLEFEEDYTRHSSVLVIDNQRERKKSWGQGEVIIGVCEGGLPRYEPRGPTGTNTRR